jgi:hypothetical protein
MNFKEAFQSRPGFGVGVATTISGFLVVAGDFAYLSASESSQEQAILIVAPWLADTALQNGVPTSVGSMHLFSGHATVTGYLAQSGLGLVPLALHTISAISFIDHDGQQHVLRA